MVAKARAREIIRDLRSGSGATSTTLSSTYVDDRAQLHCDKWIEETSFHISRYSAAKKIADKPRLSTPTTRASTPPEAQRLIIQYKSFSGDVSGVIGEAIFSCLLVQQFDLQDKDFAHFRADKLSGIFPDFGIFLLSAALETRLNWDGRGLRGPVIPAEVKTVTSANTGDIRYKLIKAIQQVQNFWVRINGGALTQDGESGVICLAVRNQDRGAYDIALIWGR
jgi:hypothetical protein